MRAVQYYLNSHRALNPSSLQWFGLLVRALLRKSLGMSFL
jgi:hypothetical protein